MTEILQTQEVGSLAKPNWRVEAVRDGQLTDANIAEIYAWSERLGLNEADTSIEITGILQDFGCDEAQCHDSAKDRVRDLAASFAVRLQERAGIDIIYDGEQDRSEMYQHAVARTNGFEPRGLVRAFDNKSYKKFAITGEPSVAQPWHEDEVDRLLGLTERPIKVPITGPYTLAAWSYDEHYGNRADAVRAIADHVIRPTIQSLLAQGVEWIQIDEPAAATVPGEVPLFVEGFNRSVAGLVGEFSVHICFSDYSLLFPHVSELDNCSQFSLEFANRDGSDLGTDAAHRPAYEILSQVRSHTPDTSVGLGVTSIHDDNLESPLLVRDRVLRAVELLGDPTLVYPSPDCGLRTRSWDVAYEKLARTAEGTALAREKLTR